ncbi:MAG: hypothetical protein H0T42_22875 [Deltaproteobacteria bacterium]|nr:hypothetical protein [Deltaproteobacteria bacterium]
MSRVVAALAALCVVALTACLPPTPAVPPAPPPRTVAPAGPPPVVPLDQDLPRLAQRATKLYQDVAEGFAAAGVDCAAATTRLRTLQQTYADVVAANAKVLHDGRARELRAALEPHAETLDTAAKAIVDSPTMANCSPDRTFTDTFDELVGAPP